MRGSSADLRAARSPIGAAAARRPALLAVLLAACGGEAAPPCDGEPLFVRGADGAELLRLCAEVATSEAARREGLAGHAPLGPDEALLLRFPVTGELCIHNAGVDFPIDALFLDEAGVVRASERFEADEPAARCHPAVADVLELAAGAQVPLGARVEPG